MGGLENKGTSFPQYVGTYNGNFTERLSEAEKGNPGVESRKLERGPNAGQIVYERFFDTLGGKLADIRVEDSDYGRQWKFVFDYQGNQFQLSFGYTSWNAEEILYRLPNVRLDQDIELKIFYRPEEIKDGKKYNGRNVLWMRQNDSKIAMKPKEEFEGLPDLERIIVQGQERWDSSLRMAFMENWVKQNVLPALHGFESHVSSEAPVMPDHELTDPADPVEAAQPPVPELPDDPEDKLPF